MATNYDELDVRFSWAGDFIMSNGDLKDSSNNYLDSLLDQIHSICASMVGDWEIYPTRGANLTDYVGEPNTRRTGERIKERLVAAITNAGLVNEEDLVITVFPVHIYKIMILIKINAAATIRNQLETGEYLQTSVLFDTIEQTMFFFDKTPQLSGGY